MLASSPSPSSAALRASLQASPSAAAHSHPSRHEANGPASQFSSPRSSRVAIEELRSALNKHSVDPSTPEQNNSGDLPRGCSSVPNTASTADNTKSLVGSSSSASPSTTSPRSDPSSTNPAATASTSSAPNPSLAPAAASSMPAPDSGSNKRHSQNDHHPPDVTPAGQSGPSGLEISQPKRLRASAPEVKVLPAQYELADTRDLVVLISSMLMELIRFNDKIPLHQGRLTRFHSRSPPRISVQDYLQRLTTHATLSPPILLSMVYYIDRLCALYPAFTVSSLTIHRFLIASATVASKGLSDSFWTNKTYSRVGGISMTELAMLELEFLFRVQWRIVPQPEVLVDYYQSLIERCDGFKIEHSNGHPEATDAATDTPPA